MSWTTTAVKIRRNEPSEHEFHNWNEENLNIALKWMKEHAQKDWIVTVYHKKDGGHRVQKVQDRTYGRRKEHRNRSGKGS